MRILFDIGANRGKFSYANRNNYDKFILVEPNPDLNNEILNYKQSNFHIENLIVSDELEPTFYLCDTLSTCDIEWIKNSRFTNSYQWEKSIPIPTITIDQLVTKYGIPTFIKIDVEGYELHAIKSMTQKYCNLSFEWAEEKKEEIFQTIDYLYQLNYTHFHVHEEDKYDYYPKDNQYETYESTITKIQKELIPSRKSKWGMIFCK
jgi:FkbM family methyltransferase